MHFHEAAIEPQKQIFAPAKHFLNAAALDNSTGHSGRLRFQRNRVKDVQAANPLPLHQWA